jgi:phage-related protein (TIGR01555 family)
MRWPTFRRSHPSVTETVRTRERIEPVVRLPLKIAQDVLAASLANHRPRSAASTPWVIPTPPPGALPSDAPTMAMDRGIEDLYDWAGSYGGLGAIGEGLRFPGYAYLAELTQRAEYRRGSEIIAREMTRKWIKLTSTGDGDKTEKLATLDAAMKRLKVQDAFRRAAEHDGFFGRAQIYLDTGATDRPDELTKPLAASNAKVARGGLKGLVPIEALWSYPKAYNASDPLKPDYFKPAAWYVMGKEIHESRLLTFIGREVPQILRPAYMFGGMSLSQLGKPYVDRWLQTTESVSALIHNFSTNVLSTNMGATLSASPGTGLMDRAALFNNMRDNSGIMLLDKESEEFGNVAVPLGTLDHLQAQSQEHMAAVWGIPLIVFFGITPSGLNASSDGELDVWNTTVEAMQEHLFGANLDRLLQIIQLSEFGEIDSDIGYTWVPLGEMDATALAAVRKSDAETDILYKDGGVLDPLEIRIRLAAAEDSLYPGLDVEDVPEQPDVGDPNAGGGDQPNDMREAADRC